MLANTRGTAKNERTNWINCKVTGDRAETLAKYGTKGKQILVEGEVAFLSGKDEKTGEFWTYTYVQVYSFEFLGGNGNGNGNSTSNSYEKPASPSDLPPNPYGDIPEADPEFEEDIPF